jgi:hypothetical protein
MASLFVVLCVAAYALSAPKAKPPAPAVKTTQASSAFDRRFVTPEPPLQTPVRTIQITRTATPAPEAVPLPPERPVVVVSERPVAEYKPRPARSRGDDLCARHGMRKVMVNRYSWRCRR